MGFFKKVFRPIRKIAKKIIPKEIRPALPFIASAAFGPAGMFGGVGSQYVSNAALRQALAAGITSAATDEDGNPLRAAGLAAAPALLSQGVGALGEGTGSIADFVNKTKTITDGDKIMKTKSLVERAQALAEPSGIMDTAKVIGGQTAIDQSAKLAEINQDEIDKYNEELRKQGVLDKTKRRTSIYNIYLNAGYEPDYVNSMLDRYGYAEGGISEMFKDMNPRMQGFSAPRSATSLFRRKPSDVDVEMSALLEESSDNDDDEKDTKKRSTKKRKKPVEVTTGGELASGLREAAQGIEAAFGTPFGGVAPAEFKRFAQGGEVEIEEETDDLGIMDLMRDQGIEYGEQVSNAQNDELLEKLFEEFLDMGFSPEDAAKKAREAFDNMSQGQGITRTQVASGYKDDIEEMYEQYVFEMEEQGLQPMSFSQFLAQARSGMADGGRAGYRKGGAIMKLINMGMDPSTALSLYDDWKDSGSGLSFEDYVGYGTIDNYKDGGITSMADGGIMEKDMRGGGFIPEGTKERADDVPARLSKNEFVMTADAVRAAGGGSVNQGAKRMYDMMYNLEGKV
jgi:hypothetical protein